LTVKQLVKCPEHGLHYDAASQTGCSLCRASASTRRSPPRAAVAGAVVLVAGGVAAAWIAVRPAGPPPSPSAAPDPELEERPTMIAALEDARRGAERRPGVPVQRAPPLVRPRSTPAAPGATAPAVDGDDLPTRRCLDGTGADGGACIKAAHVHRFGRGDIPKNLPLARRLYDRGCGAGDAQACLQLGFMDRDGEGLDAPNAASADQLFRRAVTLSEVECNAGDKKACLILADAYRNGRGVPQDLDKARQIFDSVAPGLGAKVIVD
jgi:hypothetical protein